MSVLNNWHVTLKLKLNKSIMILGIGTDIVNISRIQHVLDKHRNSFSERVYTQNELEEAETKNHSIFYYAGRWAVKEAVSKALGCGIGENCSWKDISTENGVHGQPITELSGKAACLADRMGVKKIHVSISHNHNNAIAVTILED